MTVTDRSWSAHWPAGTFGSVRAAAEAAVDGGADDAGVGEVDAEADVAAFVTIGVLVAAALDVLVAARVGAGDCPLVQDVSASPSSPGVRTRPAGAGHRFVMRWKPALNAFAVTFADRWPAARPIETPMSR
ncbi:hypothetical protein [Amnibacterium endophyticum]|uniref:Uncharacterized protein n=1 Tax=Amnibacterium endophyticum TaxID=2109337 RepID=A0ABW4LI18_9MICO